MQTLRVCVRPPGGSAPRPPAGGVPHPSSLRPMEQEGRPALPHPPQPPCAGGSRAQPGPRWAGQPRARHPPRRRPRPLHPLLGLRAHPHQELRGGAGALVSPAPPGLPCARRPRPAALPLPTVAEGRSPLGSPLPWSMAGEPGGACALRRPQGGRVLARGVAARPRLRAAPPPLTPPPRQGAPASRDRSVPLAGAALLSVEG
jgi:hypothetical protein